MATTWKERLRALRQRLGGDGPDASVTDSPRDSKPPVGGDLHLNLGIDFGTSFTKVCFRDVGAERAEVVTFGGHAVEDAMIPSVVRIGADGRLALREEALTGDRTEVRYLKMGLAGERTMVDPPAWQGADLQQDGVIEALASWFLAKVVVKSRRWIRENRADLFLGRSVRWSANVGVPVEYFDSPKLETFQRVLSVGWSWAENDDIPSDFLDARDRYLWEASAFREGVSDCHAIPEIAAAVRSFVVSRAAQPGLYIYFDIGGGTVDGVSFDFSRPDDEPSVHFYSGRSNLSEFPRSLAGWARSRQPRLRNFSSTMGSHPT